MLGVLLSYWDSKILGVMLNFRGVYVVSTGELNNSSVVDDFWDDA